MDPPHQTSAPNARVHPIDDIHGWDSLHTYTNRWIFPTSEKRSGIVTFSVVRGDGTREGLFLMLLGMKNVFVKQLLNVPGPYLSRLFLDRRHGRSAWLGINAKAEIW